MRLLVTLTAFLAVVSLSCAIFYLALTVRNLSEARAEEKASDACYDRYSAKVTGGNADTLAALSAETAAIGNLVVLLSAQPRDPVAVNAGVGAIGTASTRLSTALDVYDTANSDRTAWVKAGRPMPCPIGN
jgi:thiamine monophosphate kinase